MKSFIFIGVLAALAVSSFAASIPNEVVYEEDGFENRQGDTRVEEEFQLIYRTEVNLDPIPNAIQSKIVEYRGGANTRVSRISMLEPGLPQGANIFVNGIGTNHVTITMTSAPGKGFHYVIQMFERNTQ